MLSTYKSNKSNKKKKIDRSKGTEERVTTFVVVVFVMFRM